MVGNEMHLHSVLSGKSFSTLCDSSLPIFRGRHRHLHKRRGFGDEVRLTVAPHAQGKARNSEGQKRPLHTAIVCDAANACNGLKADISFGKENIVLQPPCRAWLPPMSPTSSTTGFTTFSRRGRRPRRAHEWTRGKIVTFIVASAANRSVARAARECL